MHGKTTYSGAQIALHWAIALLIIANCAISQGMPEVFDERLKGAPVSGFMPAFHVYAGLAVLILALIRLALRLVQGAPAPHGTGMADRAAQVVHMALYGLMIAVPAFGALSWFDGVEATADLHVLLMNVMMLMFLAHALAALFHQYVLKDGLLGRMTGRA